MMKLPLLYRKFKGVWLCMAHKWHGKKTKKKNCMGCTEFLLSFALTVSGFLGLHANRGHVTSELFQSSIIKIFTIMVMQTLRLECHLTLCGNKSLQNVLLWLRHSFVECKVTKSRCTSIYLIFPSNNGNLTKHWSLTSEILNTDNKFI
jgi:hypothetical protein